MLAVLDCSIGELFSDEYRAAQWYQLRELELQRCSAHKCSVPLPLFHCRQIFLGYSRYKTHQKCNSDSRNAYTLYYLMLLAIDHIRWYGWHHYDMSLAVSFRTSVSEGKAVVWMSNMKKAQGNLLGTWCYIVGRKIRTLYALRCQWPKVTSVTHSLGLVDELQISK